MSKEDTPPNTKPDTKHKRKRNYKACLNCRIRKIKCDLGPEDNPHPPPCERCKRQHKECLFTNILRDSSQTIVVDRVSINSDVNEKERVSLNKLIPIDILRTSQIPSKPSKVVKPKASHVRDSFRTIKQDNNTKIENENKETSKKDEVIDETKKWRLELVSMQNTLQFLANAAGSVGKQNTKDILKNTVGINNRPIPKSKNPILNETPSSVTEEEPHTCTGHLNRSAIAPLYKLNGPQKPITALIEKLTAVRPKPDRKLSDIEYIGESKLITEEEAVELIELYFSTMHPYFPNIPLQLHDPNELVQYPILLCAILTISTRYHSFDEVGFSNGDDNKRNIRVHEKLWDTCQKLISQTIWAEASTRSIGTVLAFIIFTEWNPRQIHWKKTDYANNVKEQETASERKGSTTTKDEDELTGIGAIRRSDRMSWMLTGSAVRLAQDMGFIQTSTKVFVAAHVSDALTSMNMNQKSVLAESFSEISFENNKYRSSAFELSDEDVQGNITNELFYLEHILKDDRDKDQWIDVLKYIQNEQPGGLTDLEREFLNDEFVLYYSRNNDEIVQNHQQNPLPCPLRFSLHQRAKIELVRIMLIGYDTIYYDKGRKKLASNDQVHNLAVLSILSPLIEGWHDTYRDFLKVIPGKPYDISVRKDKRAVHDYATQILHETLLCDYYYCELYIYSLALQVDAKEAKLRVNEITRSAKYVELAYNAAKEILYSSVRVHKLKLLKYMPVKWVMRIVRAVSFLVKCYLTLTNFGGSSGNSEARTILKLCCISLDETVNVIKLAALTLKEATPDELHLSIRYSAILLYLCREMKLKKERNRRLLISHGILVKEDHLGEYAKYSSSKPKYRVEKPRSSKNKSRNVSDRTDTSVQETSQHSRTNPILNSNKIDLIINKSPVSVSPPNESVEPVNVNIEAPTPNRSTGQSDSSIQPAFGTPMVPQTSIDSSIEPMMGPSSNTDEMNNTFDNDKYFLSDDAIDWFSGSTDIGLGFVEPWTEMLEQRFLQSGGASQETFNSNIEDLYNYFDDQVTGTGANSGSR